MFRRVAFLVVMIALAVPAYAELNLHREDDTEPSDYTYNTRFSLDTSLRCLQQTTGALDSFRNLTEKLNSNTPVVTKTEVPALQGIDNITWLTQNLGFYNWRGSIEGTLLKQDYLIKKLTYELEVEKNKANKSYKPESSQAYKDFIAAERTFQKFWDQFTVAD